MQLKTTPETDEDEEEHGHDEEEELEHHINTTETESAEKLAAAMAAANAALADTDEEEDEDYVEVIVAAHHSFTHEIGHLSMMQLCRDYGHVGFKFEGTHTRNRLTHHGDSPASLSSAIG